MNGYSLVSDRRSALASRLVVMTLQRRFHGRLGGTSDYTFSLSIARQISSKPSFKMRTQISMLVDRVGSHGHEHQCPSPNVLIISADVDLVEGILHENQENCSE